MPPSSSGITVPGTSAGSILTVTPGKGDYLALAQQMAQALANSSIGSTLSVAGMTAGSAAPSSIFVGTTELAVTGAGGVSTTVSGNTWN